MLTNDEFDKITVMLLRVSSGTPSPRQTLAAGLYPDLRNRLGEGEPALLVERALRMCQEDAYLRSPPAIVQLIETLLPGQAAVAAIVERLRIPPAPPPDPFDALVLVSKLPFLDRPRTRAALRRFLHDTPVQPVVVVDGAQWAGKSYTVEFVDHVLHAYPRMQHCLIGIEAGQGRSTGPGELARDIVTTMGGDPHAQPPENSNLDRWAQELANWIISVANASDRNWWFMLDGFNAAELRTTDTRLLITKLAKSLTTGMARERHRLILTDFDRRILPLRPGLIAADTTAPIPHASVASAVAEVVRQSPLPLEAAAITARILAGLADPVDDLRELSLRLSDLIASVENPALTGG